MWGGEGRGGEEKKRQDSAARYLAACTLQAKARRPKQRRGETCTKENNGQQRAIAFTRTVPARPGRAGWAGRYWIVLYSPVL